PHQFGDIGTAKAADLVDAGGRGNVYLGHIVADHVNAGEDQPAPSQFGTDRRANIAFARRQLGLLRPAADMHVGARLADRGYSVDGASKRAINKYDAFVAGPHFGKITLHDDGLAIEMGEHFHQRAEILVILAHPEDAGAAIAVKRLENDVLVPGAEFPDL